ncbi:class I SAM-dependent methyltransferase [uncultured Microscilla sp.]|uniref:class I SAM-dependent DNA methyltransferase n=1 Tax=uncultured Microscilla sp. TaxID=432653 RepID=UPI00261D878D|nr:class I SAM-dependent methyltransferase [uncultured Microscilla sp.]
MKRRSFTHASFCLVLILLVGLPTQAQTKRYDEYDPIADFYNSFWSKPLERLAIGKLNRLLVPRLKPKAKILDLMCGTGHIAAALHAQGYRMTGLDGSAKMLEFAKQNVPSMELWLKDARTFEARQKFDAVICMSDGLNHIMQLKGLTQAFTQVYKALKKGGQFVFDMNWEQRYIKGWNIRGARFEFKNSEGIFTSSYNRNTRQGTLKFWLYSPIDAHKKTWKRTQWELTQHCYTPTQIKQALEKAGFKEIKAYEAAQDLDDQRNAGRAYYVCQK